MHAGSKMASRMSIACYLRFLTIPAIFDLLPFWNSLILFHRYGSFPAASQSNHSPCVFAPLLWLQRAHARVVETPPLLTGIGWSFWICQVLPQYTHWAFFLPNVRLRPITLSSTTIVLEKLSYLFTSFACMHQPRNSQEGFEVYYLNSVKWY